jgi:y4mF family transcriptional regulator
MKHELKQYTAQEIGLLVKKTRKALGVTQKNLALTTNTGLRFIIELEHGKPTLQLEKVLTILKILGIKITIEDNNDEKA